MAQASVTMDQTVGGGGLQLHNTMLHRCCIQISSSLSAKNVSVDAEKRHLMPFVMAHAKAYPNEVARALVWRVVDTEEKDLEDRIGAWELLQSVLLGCNDAENEISKTSLADKISSFLPHLIAHRWFSKKPRRTEERSSHATGDGAAVASSSGSTWNEIMWESRRHPVVPASMVHVRSGYSEVPTNRAEVEALVTRYRRLLAQWKTIWCSDVYQRLKEEVRRTEAEGNHLSQKAAQLLHVPHRFKDSLWRLRRHSPRPVVAYHVICCYGWDPKHQRLDDAGAASQPSTNHYLTAQSQFRKMSVFPRNLNEAKEVLDATMHPGVLSWIKRLVEAKGGCQLCDTWKHEQAACPCERPFLRPMLLTEEAEESMGSANSPGTQQRRRMFRTARALSVAKTPSDALDVVQYYTFASNMEAALENMSFLEAVEILRRHTLSLPLVTEHVLDKITTLIQESKPYDEVLMAYDKVRGAITGPLERHALWIHASYVLLPSKTVFDRPSEDRLSPAMEKIELRLLEQRKHREWDQLLESVEMLDCVFRRRVIPDKTRASIDGIRDVASFFYCLVDGSLPARFTPGRYARSPEDVVLLASMKDMLCSCCLEPFHTAEHCPRGEDREPWDLGVARRVLESHGLLQLRLPQDEMMVDAAMRRIDMDDVPGKSFRKDELSLAVKLLHERREPVCRGCRLVGHTDRRCVPAALRALRLWEFDLLSVRLNPAPLLKVLEKARGRRGPSQPADENPRDLQDAYEVLVRPYVYPSTYRIAIKELNSVSIPLAAARYSTDAVLGFLLSISSNDLLPHLAPLRDPQFPEVCLYCDSISHFSESCPERQRDEDDEKDDLLFLEELRSRGIGLWEYLRRRGYYDERLFTEHEEGHRQVVDAVEQFNKDYAPGGLGRTEFLKNNGLELFSEGGGAAMLNHSESVGHGDPGDGGNPHNVPHYRTQSGSPGGAAHKIVVLYGDNNFSQLVRRPPSSAERVMDADADVELERNTRPKRWRSESEDGVDHPPSILRRLEHSSESGLDNGLTNELLSQL